MHVTGANGAIKPLSQLDAKSESDEYRAANNISANGNEPVFAARMFYVRCYCGGIAQDCFNLRNKNAMFLAFLAIASVPVKA